MIDMRRTYHDVGQIRERLARTVRLDDVQGPAEASLTRDPRAMEHLRRCIVSALLEVDAGSPGRVVVAAFASEVMRGCRDCGLAHLGSAEIGEAMAAGGRRALAEALRKHNLPVDWADITPFS